MESVFTLYCIRKFVPCMSRKDTIFFALCFRDFYINIVIFFTIIIYGRAKSLYQFIRGWNIFSKNIPILDYCAKKRSSLFIFFIDTQNIRYQVRYIRCLVNTTNLGILFPTKITISGMAIVCNNLFYLLI